MVFRRKGQTRHYWTVEKLNTLHDMRSRSLSYSEIQAKMPRRTISSLASRWLKIASRKGLMIEDRNNEFRQPKYGTKDYRGASFLLPTVPAIKMDTNAKQAVIETVYKLAYALDALDEATLSQTFTNSFHLDISALLGVPAKDITGTEYYQLARKNLGGFDATQHLLSNPLVTFSSPQEAHVKVYISAFHGIVTEGKTEGATARVFWLIDLVSKDGEEWRIKGIKVQLVAPMDHLEVFKIGHERGVAGQLRKGI
ncbi:hypothetical protein LTR78_005740 [Recurvomyces mirabilis]|uniref:SnoaL-like domain-containing protein n=1 Tax=Recurvomyces mirabilis TaxID=574656 RepID=A0AAE0WM26_9PEZI|nr:hypothetical protein LTR78_005740 [Recurvomyces mirabilis]KAK5154119.1 hypothetical protein LTS14_006804 [Recurvomyces mirabilis]